MRVFECGVFRVLCVWGKKEIERERERNSFEFEQCERAKDQRDFSLIMHLWQQLLVYIVANRESQIRTHDKDTFTYTYVHTYLGIYLNTIEKRILQYRGQQ